MAFMIIVIYLIIYCIQGSIWGWAVNKIVENKDYRENWFWWGFFFGIIALIVALTKLGMPRTTDETSNYNYFRSEKAPEFCNGYCVLPIKNPDEAPYITVIDMDGNQLFAPIKFPEKSSRYLNGKMYCYRYVSEKYIVFTKDYCPIFYQNANAGGHWAEPLGIYITLEGEVIDSEYNRVYPFSDGYSLVYKYDSVRNSYYF